MPDMRKKLDRFTATILAEAVAESERTLEQVRQRKHAAYREAEDEALLDAYRHIHSEVARIKAEAGRSVSRRMLDNKRKLYLRREEMAQETFALVREKIAAFTATPAYAERLEALLAQALAALAGADDVQVFLRGADLPLAPALERSAPGRRLAFREGTFRLGGLVASSEALGLRLDACFDSAAGELSGHFAELFGISLADDGGAQEGMAGL